VARNTENLKVPTSEQAREYGRKGGKASGEARRRKKELKELLEIALSQPCKDNPDIDNWTAMTLALLKKAKSGDTKAYEVVRDTLGQKPTDKLEANIDSTINIKVDVGE
jgi:hypothetical protein